MKTKIASLCIAAVFSILAFTTNSSAAESGFYDKDHIRGFVSVGGDFRGMFSSFHEYVNNVAFAHGTLRYRTDSTYYQPVTAQYSQFNQYYPGLQFNVGAQYKQFMTWINFNFMLTQISERPSSTITPIRIRQNGSFPALRRTLVRLRRRLDVWLEDFRRKFFLQFDSGCGFWFQHDQYPFHIELCRHKSFV